MYNIREYKGSCTCIISKTNNPPLSNGARELLFKNMRLVV